MGRYNINKKTGEEGQSLIEVLVAIGVAAIFLAAGVTAIAPIIKMNLETRTVQFADSLAQNYIDKLKNFSESNWASLYGLSKGSGNNYMLVASGTETLVISGQESSPDNDVAYGLIGHWKFDESVGTQAYDFSGNGAGGTLVNSPTRTASSSCVMGGCLNFSSSNDYIVTTNDPSSLKITGDLTISAWVYTAIPNRSTIIFKHYNNEYDFGLEPGGGFNFWHGDGAWEGVVGVASGSVPENTWTNVVAIRTMSDKKVRFYVNGQYKGMWEFSKTPTVSSNPVFIGSRVSSGNNFNGLMDDVRVYNRVLSANEVRQLYNNRIYNRSFTIENVNRNSCGVGDVTTDATSTCSNGPATSGVANDPSTQKITVNIAWSGGGSANSSINKVQYLTRTANSIFKQSDWSGGSGQEGPITSANNQYADSTNIDYSGTAGSISISSGDSGNLISSVFDTGVASGTAINSIVWQGNKPADATVKFQIASANASDGPWSYFGPDGSDTTYYSPSDANISVQANLAYHNNHRYFRYKVFLTKVSDNPRVDDIIINWSR